MIDKEMTSKLALLLYDIYEVNYLTCLAIQEMEAKAKIFDWGYSKEWCEEYIMPFKDYDEYILHCESDVGPVSEDEFYTIKEALGVIDNE